jgi:hypothetical protein
MTKTFIVSNPIRVDSKTMRIRKHEGEYILGFPSSGKREVVLNSDGLWVDTQPICI